MKYNYSVKKYYNSVEGTRCNISFSLPRNFKDPAKHLEIPMMGTGKLGRRVHPPEQRDRSNVLRAIREIRAVGLSNDWDYFVTFTLDPAKHNRSDYVSAVKKMTQYFRNLRKQGYEIEYLLIPELHSDYVNYHFHGLVKGLPSSMLTPHPLQWAREKGYKDFPEFAKRFGFVSLSPVTQTNAVVYYCLKYINKDLAHSRLNDGMHLYYVSKGVNRPQESFRLDNVEVNPKYLSNNTFFTEYATAYVRGLSPETVNDMQLEFLMDFDIEQNIKEIFA